MFQIRKSLAALILLLYTFSCKKDIHEDSTDKYTGIYSGTIQYSSNKKCYGCSPVNIDTIYRDVSLKVIPGQLESTLTLTLDNVNPNTLNTSNYKDLRVYMDSFDYYISTPGTEVTEIKGHFTNDSLRIIHNFKVYNNNWSKKIIINVEKEQ